MPQTAGIHFERHGGGDGSPPLVFVHGAGGSRLHWPPDLRRLPGIEVFAVDLPGHGDSPSGAEADVAGYARRLSGWRRALALERPVLVGHSLGSAIVLTAALAEPETLAGIVLIGAGARLKVNPLLLDSVGRAETFPAAVDRIIGWSFARSADAGLTDLVRKRMLETSPATLEADLRACNAFDATDRLRELRLPALVIVGRDDRMTPPTLSEELCDGIAGAHLEVVEAAGHMVMLERPAEVADHLQSFVRGLRLRTSAASAKGDAR